MMALQVVAEHLGVWSATDGHVVRENVNIDAGHNVFLLPPRACLTQDVAVESGQTYEFEVSVRIASGRRQVHAAQGVRLRLDGVYHVTVVKDMGRDARDDDTHAWHRLVYHAAVAAEGPGMLRISLETLASHSETAALEVGRPRLRACSAFGAAAQNVSSNRTFDVSLSAAYHSGSGPLAIGWRVSDEESGIARLLLAAGTSEGGAQLLDFVPVDAVAGRAEVDGLHMVHNSRVWVQLVADNTAGLRSVFRAQPVRVDRTPAAIFNVAAPAGLGGAATELSITWEVSDEESGVSWCRASLGTAASLDDIVSFTPAASGTARRGRHSFSITGADWMTDRGQVYATVRCGNGAGLVAQEAVGDKGTLILLTPPSAASATIVVTSARGASAASSPYEALPGVQTSTSLVEASWSGFNEVAGHVASYKARLVGPGVDTGFLDMGLRQEVRFSDLELSGGSSYHVEVLAEDIAGQESQAATANIAVLAGGPVVADMDAFCAGFVGDAASTDFRLVIGWTGVFGSFGCETSGEEGDACARFFVDVGRFQHGRDVASMGGMKGGTAATTLTIDGRHLARTPELTAVDVSVSYYVTLTAIGASGVPTTASLRTVHATQACAVGDGA